MITYIIITTKNEYYCGKTNNLDKRIKEHLKEKPPSWFVFNQRKHIKEIYFIDIDLEKKIKKFGIKNLIYIINNYKMNLYPTP